MKYKINEDLIFICEMLQISQDEMAISFGVDKKIITRIENSMNYPTSETLKKIYDFAYKNGFNNMFLQ